MKPVNAHMIDLPGGTIALRDDRTQRKWTADIAPFSLARYPVTQSFYTEITGLQPSAITCPNCPVETVTWRDAARFCNTLSRKESLTETYFLAPDDNDVTAVKLSNGYRLPSEAEWEFACRAGSREIRYGPLDDIAWYSGNANGAPQPVGLKQPNSWGLYDMLGNVWEWCHDIYDPAVYGSYRIFRGGGWADKERGCLATNRRRSHPTFSIDDLGFRVARTRQ